MELILQAALLAVIVVGSFGACMGVIWLADHFRRP
jgi:hypothetical protein